MRHDDSLSERCRSLFRKHERRLAVAWLLGLVLLLGVLAVHPVRLAVLRGLQTAIDRWDSRWTQRLARAEAMVEAGRYEEAISYLERLDDVFPARDVRHARDKERERLLQLLALSYEATDRKSRAMAVWDSLVAFDSLNYYNYFERGQAAERMLSGWALAEEARDGYAVALQRHPSHLPSLRGYIDFYMDRGEFIPVVQAYQTYLDAFLAVHLTVHLGADSLVTLARADGIVRRIELPLATAADTATTLSIDTKGFPVRVEGITVIAATRVGTMHRAQPVDVAPDAIELMGLERVDDGALRPTDTSTRATFRLPPIESGIAGVHVHLRVFKPLDQDLWTLVAKSYRNLLDPEGLRLATERTITISDPDLADRVLMEQAWAREGLRLRLDVGT